VDVTVTGSQDAEAHLVLQALAEVGAAFTGTRKLRPVLDRLLEAALRVGGGDAGSIMLLIEEGVEIEVVAARGPRATLILGARQRADRSVAGWALRQRGPLLMHGGAVGQPTSDFPRDLASSVVARLEVAGRVLGVLNVSRDAGAPRMTAASARLLELLARQAAILIDNSRLMEELQRKEERLEQLVDQLLRETGRDPTATADGPVVPLSPREREVLVHLVEGRTNREIAGELVVEPDTVKDHVQSIMKKLNASDRTHAAVIAVRRGLVA
jgi:DNA-binding CsgD family transcriptional regulator